MIAGINDPNDCRKIAGRSVQKASTRGTNGKRRRSRFGEKNWQEMFLGKLVIM